MIPLIVEPMEEQAQLRRFVHRSLINASTAA
jgi:hypothetical protein